MEQVGELMSQTQTPSLGFSFSSKALKPRTRRQRRQEPPKCQVEGCFVDLSDAKPYYARHKVCCNHSKYPQVTVAGLQQRFCQQCSRFHKICEFDPGKRSCRRRLADHNQRRRKQPKCDLLGSSFSSSIASFNFAERSFDVGRYSFGNGNPSLQSGVYNEAKPVGGMGVASYSRSPTVVSEADSICALSLLSNQQWCTTPSNQAINGMTNNYQPINSGVSNVCFDDFLGEETVGYYANPMVSHLTSKLDLSHQSSRMLLDFELANGLYGSNSHVHWSL